MAFYTGNDSYETSYGIINLQELEKILEELKEDLTLEEKTRLLKAIDIEKILEEKYKEGYEVGEEDGYEDGYDQGYEEGYNDGLAECK